jgi:energy-coupling factor transporter ATP-binding protein EcfA2
MIRRIYIDNYRCFSNFEMRPEALNLLLGDNGSGKSSMLEVVQGLVDLITGRRRLSDLFSRYSRTRWDRRGEQRFELDLEVPEAVRAGGGQGLFRYSLRLKHSSDDEHPMVLHEALQIDTRTLYEVSEGMVSLFGDDSSKTSEFPFSSRSSYLAFLEKGKGGQELMAFKRAVEEIVHLAVQPDAMSSTSHGENERLASDGSNFVSWYHAVVLERQEVLARLFKDLGERIPGLEHLNLEKISSDKRHLVVTLLADSQGTSYRLRFDELSTGQKALVFFYTLLHTVVGQGSVLMLDEPDNFVALREIQPWLIELCDRIDDGPGQVFLISHHPEVMDYLVGSAWFFERLEGGPVRVRRVEEDSEPLPFSERMARGWLTPTPETGGPHGPCPSQATEPIRPA